MVFCQQQWAVGTDSLSVRAAMISKSLRKSQTITNSVVSILSSFDHCLSALETSMHPTHGLKQYSNSCGYESLVSTLIRPLRRQAHEGT
ncbi:hypothetical protein ACE6H2_022488 [Prunus campanulata]